MPKNELRDIDFMSFVDLDGYRFTIIDNSDFVSLNSDLNLGHLLIPLIIIRGIDKHLIEYLIKPRNIPDFPLHKFLVLDGPHKLLGFSARTNVHIRAH